MKRVVLVSIFSIALNIFSSALFCENYLDFDSRIPDKSYFMIGDIIYEEKFESQNSLNGIYHVCYRYVGFSDDSVSFRSEYVADDNLSMPNVPPEMKTIIVPLDRQNKGYLSSRSLPKPPPEAKVSPVKLVISVYDRQKALISVSQYGLKHISQPLGSASYKKSSSSLLGQKQESRKEPEPFSMPELPTMEKSETMERSPVMERSY